MGELGEIDMVSGALARLDLVTHDGAVPGSPAVYLAGRAVLSCAGLAGSLGVPGRHVVIRRVGDLPRTPGGKVDYRALAGFADLGGGAG